MTTGPERLPDFRRAVESQLAPAAEVLTLARRQGWPPLAVPNVIAVPGGPEPWQGWVSAADVLALEAVAGRLERLST